MRRLASNSDEVKVLAKYESSIKYKPSFTTICARLNQYQKGRSCQSISALTLPSSGLAYGKPLMSNVRALKTTNARLATFA